MGISGIGGAALGAIAYKNKSVSGSKAVQVSKPEPKKRKRLQYSFKRIGYQIMTAKTSGSARRVLTRAKSQTVTLLRKKAGGEYDETELRHAIIHARKMERIAKKKMKHLQEEERAKKQGGPCEADLEEKTEELLPEELEEQEDVAGLSAEEMKRLLDDLMREMEDMMKELEELENGDLLEELSMTELREMDPADLELLKKKHRSEELRDIVEADMKYLKALFDKFERDKESASQAVSQAIAQSMAQQPAGGVSLELAGAEVPIPVMEASAAEVIAMGEGTGGNFDASV